MSALQFALRDATVLDLFAGSGALGIEALSRGASHVTFVETWKGAADVLQANLDALNATERATILRRDAIEYAARLDGRAFDIAVADPPYGQGLAGRLVELFSERQFAGQLWVEHRSNEVLPAAASARTRRYGETSITSIPAEP